MKTNKKTGSVSKVLVAGLLMGVMTFTKAQDVIILNSGSEFKVKLIELNETEIKYKKFENPTGPTYTTLKAEVFAIQYENGNKDVITKKVDVGSGKDPDFVSERRLKFGGPRFGLTAISDGTMSDKITSQGKTPLLTQFGYQFETRLFTADNGAQGIVEFIPLVAGMEQGLFLPSGSFLIGLRGGGSKAFEFALGPTVSISGLGMVFAVGTNFRSGNINFPVNLAVVPSVGSVNTIYDENSMKYIKVKQQTGLRVTLTIGFNTRKK